LTCTGIISWTQADRDAVEAELSGRLQEACDSATQWKEAAERVAAEKGDAEHAQAAAQLAALQASSADKLVRSATRYVLQSEWSGARSVLRHLGIALATRQQPDATLPSILRLTGATKARGPVSEGSAP
jgi:hypothetical protein